MRTFNLKTARIRVRFIALSIGLGLLFFLATNASAQIDVTRMLFTPAVVPETQTDPVRFEATVTGNPPSVAFRYDNVDRPMYNDGTHGDLTAGDATWTVTFTANEILSKNTPNRLFRPIIGTCRPVGGGIFNVIGEVWTSTIGTQPVQSIDATGQQTSYVANYVATKAQLLNLNQQFWAQRFYATHGDTFDFINFVLIGGPRGNRGHTPIKNAVQGVGMTAMDGSSGYGSAGRLLGTTLFPVSSTYDAASPGFSHETGHQWMQFMQSTPFTVGVPHWPAGNVATNVMGISIGGPNGVGGNHPYAYVPNGSGGYVVNNGDPINLSTFNALELYLMGFASSTEVGNLFILNDQVTPVSVGQVIQPNQVTNYSVGQIIGVYGTRVPNSTQSQKAYRTATIVLSEQLLDARTIAFYDYFTRRAESQQQLAYAEGLINGTTNPWFLATGGRSTMTTMIVPVSNPTFTISGRVATPSGALIRSATVILTDSQGVRRIATTSSFGIFTFTGIPAGSGYTMGVTSRRYRFTPKTLSVSGSLTNVDFTGLE